MKSKELNMILLSKTKLFLTLLLVAVFLSQSFNCVHIESFFFFFLYTPAIPGAPLLWDIESFYRYCNCVVLLGFSFLHQVLDEHRLQLKNLAPASKCLRAVIIHQDELMFKGFCTFNSSSLDPSLSCASVHVFNHSLSHARHSQLAFRPIYKLRTRINARTKPKPKIVFTTLAVHVDIHMHKPAYTTKRVHTTGVIQRSPNLAPREAQQNITSG